MRFQSNWCDCCSVLSDKLLGLFMVFLYAFGAGFWGDEALLKRVSHERALEANILAGVYFFRGFDSKLDSNRAYI